jgi:dGTPase
VLHSSGLRRLAGKTQVVVAGEQDFPRTRLTHSLEVGQIGRELGMALGADPDLVEVACLSHDLGHPPFGHNGEDALDAVSAGIGGFEGNAQTFRLLTRLEAKTFDGDHSVGLNLTRAALDATTKYPWPRRAGLRKFGVYDDDLPAFEWVRAGVSGEGRCFEAQVMDFSDDVAYSVHDLEDAVHVGHLDLIAMRSADERAAVAEVAREAYAPDADVHELEAALTRIQDVEWWVTSFDGTHRSLAGLKNMSSRLIGRFAGAAEEATLARYGYQPLTRYAADLVIPHDTELEVAVLKAVTNRYVMQRAGAAVAYARQRLLLTDLVQELMRHPEKLDHQFGADFVAAANDDVRLRVVVDQVAAFTDQSAIALAEDLDIA